MATRKFLIVNADDFGQSRGVNRGIAEGHEYGIVTSASLMVRWPAAAEAAAYAQAHPQLSVGLHVDFGEWAFRGNQWVRLYQVADENDPTAVAKEVERQLNKFRQLLAGNPTHIDSHQHCHRREPLRSIVLALAGNLGIPSRACSSGIRYTGAFYGQTDDGSPYPDGIKVENLLRIFRELPWGWTELSCHPARGVDLDTMYQIEREQELKTLRDPGVREAIQELGVELRSFCNFLCDPDVRNQPALTE